MCSQWQLPCPSKFWSIFLYQNNFFCLLAFVKDISNRKNIFFPRNLDSLSSRFDWKFLSGKITVKLLSTNIFLRENMSKINTNETKLKQSQLSQNCWKPIIWTKWRLFGPLISFLGAYHSKDSLKISVWVYNFIANQITRIFVDKKYDVVILSCYIFDFTC